MPQVRISEGEVRDIDGLVEISLDPKLLDGKNDFLQTVNALLAEHRLKAWDHEAQEHGGKGEMFFGAALIKSKAGKYYLSANIHVHNHDTPSRNCAEANATIDAINTEGAENLEITEVWFMGGKGDLSKNMRVLPDHSGKRTPPCGSCLDVLFKRSGQNGADVPVHMLPLNDGTWRLEPDNGAEKLESSQVKTQTLKQLFPHITTFLQDKDGELKKGISAGYAFLTDETTQGAIDNACACGEIQRLATLEKEVFEDPNRTPDAIAEEINRILMETLKKEYTKEGETPLKKGSIAIVRTVDGSYHLGTYFDDGKSRSTPSAVQNALQNARRERVTDVFILPVDFQKLEKDILAFEGHPEKDVEVSTPDGATTELIGKARPKKPDYARGTVTRFNGEPMQKGESPHVHVFFPNHPKEFAFDRHSFSISNDKMRSGQHISPKMEADSAGIGI